MSDSHFFVPQEVVLAALKDPACERVADWYTVGPVQRAAFESFAAAVVREFDKFNQTKQTMKDETL